MQMLLRVFMLALVTCFSAFATQVHAQETCGLQDAYYQLPDSVFRNGFETSTVIAAMPLEPRGAKLRSAKGSGLGPPLTTVNPPALGVTPTVTITDPPVGASVPVGTLQVEGTYTGPTNTGISVNGVPAFTWQNRFLSAPISIESGAQTIKVVATTLDNLTAEATRSITSSVPPAQDVRVIAGPPGGFAPFKTLYRVAVRQLDVQTVAVDFDGNGTDDYTGSAGAIPIHTYSTPGVYDARITVTTKSAQVVVRHSKVMVISLPETRERACAVFAHFRTQLAVNSASGALQAMHEPLAFEYQQVLDALGANLPTFASRIGTIATGIFSPRDAELIVVKEVGADVIGSPVHVTQSSDGVWRIDNL